MPADIDSRFLNYKPDERKGDKIKYSAKMLKFIYIMSL